MYDNSRSDGSNSAGVAIVAVLVGVVFLGGVLGLGGAFWMYSRTRHLQALEERARAEAMQAQLVAEQKRAEAEALRADSVAEDGSNENRETQLATVSGDVTIHIPRDQAIRLEQGISQLVSSNDDSLSPAISEALEGLASEIQSALQQGQSASASSD